MAKRLEITAANDEVNMRVSFLKLSVYFCELTVKAANLDDYHSEVKIFIN